MVKIKETSLNIETWFETLSKKYQDPSLKLIRNTYAFLTSLELNHPMEGIEMAEILFNINADEECLAAALLYPFLKTRDVSIEIIQEKISVSVAKLLQGTEQMNAVHYGSFRSPHQPQHARQLDNIRKMVLAMAEDVRVVLIKLAEQLVLLRHASKSTPEDVALLAKETKDIYAPLANRLGIYALKWELEDLSLRYREPEQYQTLAKKLESSRLEREKYLSQIQNVLCDELSKAGLHSFEISARAKHIEGIYRKMLRKSVDYSQIYDALAIRILVTDVETCYTVLGLIHGLWTPIPEEFDDYITHPKPNGYQSLHTAVTGPQGKNFEIQIRTYAMHESSEKGIAAHWKYKEGALAKQAYEEKINWLRQLLDWQNDLTQEESGASTKTKELFSDRVYVFTPNYEIIDLPKGATPLDFAYQVHTEIGHRCRGAKINGHIVPLTHVLNTGETVEIITAKSPRPSRDWLNAHAGYLFTPRAKAKVAHWFKEQDYDHYVHEGQRILNEELVRWHLEKTDLTPYWRPLQYHTFSDFLAAIGRSEVKLLSFIHSILHSLGRMTTAPKPLVTPTHEKPQRSSKNDVIIEGLEDLLMTFSKCCKPVPGDQIIGYVTKERGVTIHAVGCPNLKNFTNRDKLLNAYWVENPLHAYPVDLILMAHNRDGLVHEITTLVSHKKLRLLHLSTYLLKGTQLAQIKITLEIKHLDQLQQIIAQLHHVHAIIEIKRGS